MVVQMTFGGQYLQYLLIFVLCYFLLFTIIVLLCLCVFQVADMPNDDIIHFDLVPENTPMSNWTQSENGGTETSKEAAQLPFSASGPRETTERELRTSTDALHTEPVICPQKKIIKPPMPPTNKATPTTHEVEQEKESYPTKKVCKICLNSYNIIRHSVFLLGCDV